MKDENNNAIMAPLPTVFRDMVGAVAMEYDPIGYDSVALRLADGTSVTGRQWCDVLETEGAEVVARYDGGFYRGSPAVTRNAFGQGSVYYIGTVGEQALYNVIARQAVEAADVPFIPDLPAGVEVTTRTGKGRTTRFIFNNTATEQHFSLDGAEMTLAPFEMRIQQA